MSRSGPAPDGSCRFRSVRPLLLAVGAAVLAPLPAAPAALAQDGPAAVSPSLASAIRSEIGERARGDLRAFYLARGNRPLWLDDAGRISPAAGLLLREVDSAKLDGLKPGKLKAGRLERRWNALPSRRPKRWPRRSWRCPTASCAMSRPCAAPAARR